MRIRFWHKAAPALASTFALIVACGGSTVAVGGDAASDVDAAVDDASSDVRFFGDAVAPDVATIDAGPCEATWCGCGACTDDQIICTHDPKPCALDCAVQDCPQLKKVTCTAVGDRCVRGGLTGPIGCATDGDCPPDYCCPPPVPGQRTTCLRTTGGPCGGR